MKKIAILQDDFPPFGKGGASSIVYALAKGYKKEGYDVRVITTVQRKEYAGEDDIDGITVLRIYTAYSERWRAYRSIYNRDVVREVKKALRTYAPDVVHAHNVHQYLSYHTLYIAQSLGAYVILTAHDAMLFHYGKLNEFAKDGFSCGKKHDYRVSSLQLMKRAQKRYNPFRNLAIQCYLRSVDIVVSVSAALADALVRNGIHVDEIVRNGIDQSDWNVSDGAVHSFKDKHSLEKKKVVLFGGRLSEAKGGRYMIEAMKKVTERIPGAVLLVLGQVDGYAKEMLTMARNLGIEKSVIFVGWVSGDDLKAAYGASDVVCVLSGYLDPFPTINLEAMTMKKPVVGTCLGGTPEAVLENKTGIIVDPFDTDSIARALTRLLKDESMRLQYGRKGHERIRDEFSLKSVVHSYTRLFYGKINK